MQPPSDVTYIKPLPKRSTITVYGFTKPPSKAPPDAVDTSVFYSPPPLPPLPHPPTKKTTLVLTVHINSKNKLKGEDGLLVFVESLGESVKGKDGRKLHNVDLIAALKAQFT
jgi:hypothetical protein